MTDEAATARPADAAERARREDDRRLLRAVRWRLVAWSGLTTLVALVVLGAVLYAIVARSLAAEGADQLEDRATAIRQAIAAGRPGPALGQVFGGRASGTIAVLVDADGRAVVRAAPPPAGLPEPTSLAAARAVGRDLRTATVDGAGGAVPVRVLTERLTRNGREVYLQVVGDRVAEQRTLGAMLVVLVGGGLAAVLAAVAVGAVYARRALVPIRDSLEAQAAALRRQRAFAADASHELRTPLTVVRASLEHLRRHPDRPIREVADAVDDIDAEIAHLSTLVDDLLLLARSDSGALAITPLPLDLGDLAAQAVSGLATAAGERGVRVVLDPEPAVVRADGARLRQLVAILVDNAIRHSPRGGEVRVRVREAGGAALLEVEDDGPGIREEDLPHVFDRFWRAPTAPSGGSGLGLSIARTIVEGHGGRIMVAAAAGGGARFRATLPLAPSGGPADRP